MIDIPEKYFAQTSHKEAFLMLLVDRTGAPVLVVHMPQVLGVLRCFSAHHGGASLRYCSSLYALCFFEYPRILPSPYHIKLKVTEVSLFPCIAIFNQSS